MPLAVETAAGCLLRAVELRRQHRMSACFDALEQALALDPHSARAKYELAFAQLLTGNYREGFRNYESRWGAAGLPRPVHTDQALLGPEWRGEPLRGKRLLLHAEQGFGDTIQFLRYAPLVSALGGDVTLEVQPQLRDLAACVQSGCTIGSGAPAGKLDFHRSLIDLPAVFGTALDTVPPPARIEVPAAKEEEWRRRLAGANRRKIGLVWAGNPNNSVDRERSVPFTAADAMLTSFGDAQVFSFQVGRGAGPVGTEDLAPFLQTFVDTAAALQQMDHIVTVDTAVAHLAGSLGLKVWVLLPYSACWRWLLHTASSPWYPTMRLIRQPWPGNWAGAFKALQKALYIAK